ncbi:MAG: flavodoxin domain-containing protein [Bacteroidales bacterium]|jgi:menaquinone-dependent protoporphyrinogen oxidase
MVDIQLNRRKFLLLAGGVLGAGAIATCAISKMAATPGLPVLFPETNINNPSMTNKILVTYASRTGFTGGVAEKIKKTLEENGLQVDLCLMKNVRDLSSYQAVVAGSAVQDRQWLPEAMEFMKIHQKALSQKPFAAFMVCMTLAMPNAEKYREGIMEWLNPVRELVKPVSEGFFAGGLDIAKIPSLGARIKFRISVLVGVWKEGDHRDWEAIDQWSTDLKNILA